ncbi:Fumarate reductase [Mycena indigotica]|uniref:Fumarate reductase n=1 Tax=Mycena indigotica TaxID=2126181 RepID=A0A8H6TGC8_9AGAR|nr:Fumarate reductase [Mycena indigotica]KAF7315250.1 Fumarate reductase [Mycena indigotica]
MPRVVLVGVGGATCSGKTTLAKHLKRILPNSVIIHQDDFAPPQELVPIHPIHNVQDWDAAPGAIDWPRLIAFLRQVKATGEIPADHRSHDHLNEQKDVPIPAELRDHWISAFEPLNTDDTIWGLVDGFLLYWHPEVIEQLDVRIFLRVPHDVLRERRYARHGYHTAVQSDPEGTLWRDPPNYWEQIVYPAYVDANREVFIDGDVENGKPTEKVEGLALLEGITMGDAVSRSCELIASTLRERIRVGLYSRSTPLFITTMSVIVVGGGLAGLSAAHTLLERGANVLLLDKQGFMGGNSTKATSGINGAGTQTQQEAGIPDNAKTFFEDTKKSARDLARDDLIRVLTGRSGDAVNWLQDKFSLDLSKVARLGGHSHPRTHRGDAQFPGMVITYAQMERLEDLAVSNPERVKILKKARVSKLLKDDSGAVIGVEYQHGGKTNTAHGPVILATGGYAADFTEDSLLKKYRPELWDLPTTNGDHCTGDGQKLAMNVGAQGIDLEKVQVHPTGLVDPNEPEAKVKFLAAEALRGVGGLLLDNTGSRFVDELQHRDYVTGKIWENKKYPIRLVLNGPASKEIEWHCKHYVGRGLMKRFENGDALSKEMGLPPSVLKKTFEDYNNSVRTKKDPFGKKFFQGEWKYNDVFHVAIMTPVLHYTMGGLEIDPESRVIDTKGKPIPGLFAAGEVAGGVHGANRLGGSSLLGCVVFGRVSGDSAAAYMLQAASKAIEKAGGRLGAVAGQLGAPAAAAPSSSAAPAASGPKSGSKEFTAEEVAKHNKKDDIWVIVDGEVLDVTNFLPDHPGGEKAILLYAGRDATEEFLMLHEKKVIGRYAPEAVIGKLRK